MNSAVDTKPIYFISDLHLSLKNADSMKLFSYFINEYAPTAKSIYILGDLFDYWIGDDDQSPFNEQVINTLKQASSNNCSVFFMPGNRDFLIGETFLHKAKMQLLPDPYLLVHDNQRILLTHGDLLCRNDKLHLMFRKLSQSKLGKKMLLKRSLDARQKLAMRARSLSRGNKEIMHDPVSVKFCHKLMHMHKAKIMIHGHTHQPGIHKYDNENHYKRYVLSDWHEQSTILKLDHEGTLTQVTLQLPNGN